MSAGTPSTSTQTPPGDTAPSDAFAAADLTCPRCGYDQSGLEQSLRSQCERGELDAWPLKSMCAECGREFQWGNFYNTKPRESEFFETATTRQFRAFWKTVWRMPRAGRFWRGVDAEWPVRTWRLCVVSLAASALWLSVTVIAVMAATALLEQVYSARWPRIAGMGIPLPDPVRVWGRPDPLWVAIPWENLPSRPNERVRTLVPWLALAWVPSLLMPAVLAVGFYRVARPTGARPHLARVWVYGFPRLSVVTVLAISVPRMVVPLTILVSELLLSRRADDRFGDSWNLYFFCQRWHPMALAGCILFFTWRWWSSALRNYLKLAQPDLVAAIALGVAFTICWLLAVQSLDLRLALTPR